MVSYIHCFVLYLNLFTTYRSFNWIYVVQYNFEFSTILLQSRIFHTLTSKACSLRETEESEVIRMGRMLFSPVCVWIKLHRLNSVIHIFCVLKNSLKRSRNYFFFKHKEQKSFILTRMYSIFRANLKPWFFTLFWKFTGTNLILDLFLMTLSFIIRWISNL